MHRLLIYAVLLRLITSAACAAPQHIDYYATLAFRESPYAPHLGVRRLTAVEAGQINHYRFEYDAQGRIQRISFQLGDQPRAPNHTANYFWYASAEHYRYVDDLQVVSYYDQYGRAQRVHGEVMESRYRLDDSGRRLSLTYLDAAGEATESAWGIARYHWQQVDGSVIENRYSLRDEPVGLRPGFPFNRIRLSYGATGLTQLMQHVDEQGRVIAAADSFAQDRFTYTRFGELARYEVLDAQGRRGANNMQGIASGVVSFSDRGYELIASYEDAQGEAAYNDNGWWISQRRYDRYGNMTLNAFADREGKRSLNPNTGYAELRLRWHDDGLRRRELAYFDQTGQPVSHIQRGFHAVRYRYDDQQRLQLVYLVDTAGNLVEHAQQGWALTRHSYDNNGAPEEPERLSLAQARAEELQHVLEQLHGYSGVPGMAAAVAENGQLLWHGEAGLADLAKQRPVTAQTQFRLASVSKAVTGILVAQALADQRLHLDSRVDALLPLAHSATLRQLLAHTGAVDHYRQTITVDLERDYASAREALVTVEPHLLQQLVGETYRYSTFGYTLVGAMLEVATELPYSALLADLAVQQELPSLQGSVGERNNPLLTQFYALNGELVGPAKARNFSYGVPGAGVIANASDLAVLVSRFASDQLVDTEQRDQMLEVQHLNNGEAVADQRYEVALGWRRQADASGRVYYHHGGVTDGARAVAMFDPASGRSVALLSNASWTSDVYAIALSLLRVEAAPAELDRFSVTADAPQLSHNGLALALSSADCSVSRCAWTSTGSGELGQWLARSGRGTRVQLEVGLYGARIYDAYGVTPLLTTARGEQVADQGSQRFTLQ